MWQFVIYVNINITNLIMWQFVIYVNINITNLIMCMVICNLCVVDFLIFLTVSALSSGIQSIFLFTNIFGS